MDHKWRGIYIKWTANGEASNGQNMEWTANGCNMSQMDLKQSKENPKNSFPSAIVSIFVTFHINEAFISCVEKPRAHAPLWVVLTHKFDEYYSSKQLPELPPVPHLWFPHFSRLMEKFDYNASGLLFHVGSKLKSRVRHRRETPDYPEPPPLISSGVGYQQPRVIFQLSFDIRLRKPVRRVGRTGGVKRGEIATEINRYQQDVNVDKQ
eukprot:scaffold42408_cov38-Cyclotella_meneghiniana.AAC.3